MEPQIHTYWGGEGDRAQYLITETESCEHTSHQSLDRLQEMITYHLLTSKWKIQ